MQDDEGNIPTAISGNALYKVVEPDHQARWCHALGYRMIREATLEIGSQVIDKVFSDYLYDIWNELSAKPGKTIGEMIGDFGTESAAAKYSMSFRRLHVPLPFFCTRSTGSSLPIVSLQFHTVQVRIDWNSLESCIVNYNPTYDDGTGAVQYKTKIRSHQTGVTDRSTTIVPVTATDPDVTANHVTVQVEALYAFLDLAERKQSSRPAPSRCSCPRPASTRARPAARD